MNHDDQLLHLAHRLHREFRGVFGIETIERFLADSAIRTAYFRVTTYRVLFIERFARERLRALAQSEGPS